MKKKEHNQITNQSDNKIIGQHDSQITKQPATDTSSLKWFMIKWFLLIMLFIFVSEELINLFYDTWVRDFLTNVMHVDALYISAKEGSILMIILQMLILSISVFLPDKISMLVQKAVGNQIGSGVSIDVSSPLAEGLSRSGFHELYQFAVIIIYFSLLVLTLLPYVIAAYWYYKIISHKVQELMEQEKKQKEEYDRQRNLLLSDIAHDIKTPITTVCGYAKALSDHVVAEEEKKEEYLQAIYAKSMRMSELITLLFEYVKLDSSGFSLHKEDGDLAELLRENVALLYADFEEKGIRLLVDIPEEKCPLTIDKIQMSRAISNILTNMVRYNEKGTTVLVQLKNACQIRIADNGVPIEKELAEHIFEPFTRGDEARSTKGGNGLGLSIAAKIIKMHDGELTLERNCPDGYVKAFVITFADKEAETE